MKTFKELVDEKYNIYHLENKYFQCITNPYNFYEEICKLYAEEVIEKCAENAKMTGIAYGNDTSITDYEVDKESILKVKQLLKQ